MKKKLTLVVTCIVLVAAMVIGGTLAYFTDTTEAKKNTFTVGNVGIELTESDWTENDNHTLMPGTSYAKNPTITVDETSQDAWVFLRIDLNKYVSFINLVGVDAYKNEIGGLKGSYPGFLAFMENLLDNNRLREAVVDRWFTGIDHTLWKMMNVDELKTELAKVGTQDNPKHLSLVLGYQKGTLKAKDSVTFMTAFGMPDTITAAMFDGDEAYKIEGVSKSNFNTANSKFAMTFTAYAIQAAELKTLDLAYEALFAN